MVINICQSNLVYKQIAGLTLALTLSFSTGSFATAENGYYYWRGQDKIEMTLVPNELIEFTAPEQDPQTPKIYKVLASKKLTGGARHYKLRRTDFAKVISAKPQTETQSQAKASPLFREGSDYKALSGGVFVTFKLGTTDAAIEQYCKERGLKLKKRYSIGGQAPLWLIETPSGIESLNLANSLQENPADIVDNAKPSFWYPIETRELKKIHRSRRSGVASR